MNGETRARLMEVISWLKNKTLPDAGRMETKDLCRLGCE